MTLVLSQVFSKKMHRWLCVYLSLRKDGWQRILGRKWISTLSSSEKAGKIIGLFTNVNETKFLVWWMNVKQLSWWSSQEKAPDVSWSREVLNNHALKKLFFTSNKRSWIRLTYPVTFIEDNMFDENITSFGDKNGGLIRRAKESEPPLPFPLPSPAPNFLLLRNRLTQS